MLRRGLPVVLARVGLPAVFAASACATPPVAKLPLRPRDEWIALRYQERFAGALPGRTRLETWTLRLDSDAASVCEGRFELEHTEGRARASSIVDGPTRPDGPIAPVSRATYAGIWRSDCALGVRRYVLDFGARVGPPVHCFWSRASALPRSARIDRTPVGRNDAPRPRPWAPAAREDVDAFKCDRGWLASPPTWSVEPQPDMLPFGPMPGLEYAHENDDMVVQQGALRLL